MKEYAFGEQLFIADDGRPMEFYLRCQEKEELEEYIKHAGGSLVRHPGSFTIIIEDASQDTPTATLESFKSDFIIQCCIQNKILPLKQFWCNPVTSFSADFDPNLVLHRKISWIDARIKFKTGTEEPDSDASVTENDGEEPHTRPYKPRKNSRTEFTRQDQKKIVDYIVKNKLFTDVKGTAMWMRMEQKFKNHTWQSLKEHFLKKILPVINTFNLSEAEVGWFRCSAAVKNPKPRQQRRAYSHEEDKRILKYVSIHADERTYLWGNVFWQLMEKKNTVPGRTWYSLKERYTKYLAPGKRSEYKNDETASDSNEIENVPSSPEEASASACCKRGSSAPGKASSSAWLTNNVSSKPGSASESVFKIKSVSLIPKTSIPSTSMCKMKSVSAVPEAASSSAGEMNSVSSTPEKTSTIASKTKSAPLTPREPSSACKKSCQNDEEGSPIPLKTKKRKLFDASSAVLPDFSPVFVKETGPSWLEKKFNNSTNKKFGKLAAMVTQLQDVPENLPVNVHTQNDEDVPNLDSVDLFASSSNNQDSTSSRIQNEPSETCGRDQIPVPANDDDCGQKEKDVQHFGSVDLFASSNANNQAQSSRKEGEMSPVQHRSSDHDQGTESEWPSNFPPEPVHFISDSENDPADEGFEGDTDDGIDNVTSDSEWSDDGLFWRGGVEFPDGLRKKRHPFAHLNPVPMMDFITLHKGRTEEQSKANRNQSEVDKQDSTVSRKLSLPKNISKVAPKTISEQPNNIRVRRVADPFLPKLSNSYDPSQMSVINCSGASSSVGTHQEQAHQHKNSLTTESNSSNNCQEAIIDKFKSVGVQPTVGDKRDVSVQTDPVLVLPMNWRSKFPNFEKQIFLSSSTDDLQLEPPEPTTLHAGCPSPAPANCSPSSDSDE